MFITTLSINVGRSKANRSLVMDVFSFVDLLFIVDSPERRMVVVLYMNMWILICFLLFRRLVLRCL